MKKPNIKPLSIDDQIPSAMGRTDEGTPISLADFSGRALAVFFLGKGFGRTENTLVKNLKRRVDEFLEFECSPIVVAMESSEVLASVRESEALPFLMISDVSGGMHGAVCGEPTTEAIGSWLVSDDGKIVAAIHPMPPREQVSATIAALSRVVESMGNTK